MQQHVLDSKSVRKAQAATTNPCLQIKLSYKMLSFVVSVLRHFVFYFVISDHFSLLFSSALVD